jgi:DNA polymerase
MSVDSFSHKWERTKTYGGKLSENITQAVARDLLSASLISLEGAGYPVVAHVHDEIIVEANDQGPCTLEQMEKMLSTPPEWAKDLPLAASGFISKRYQK